MNLPEALETIQRVVHPVTLQTFFGETIGQQVIKVGGTSHDYRAGLLGPDPEKTILDDYVRLAPILGCHADAPLGPRPVAGPVANSAEFRAKIETYHQLGYTVRFPELSQLSPGLGKFVRALELALQKPVQAEAFWSGGDAKAPVHFDDYDIIVVHLKGRKQWFISGDRSDLPNAWKKIPSGPIRITNEKVVDVGPGDLLYLPRGTPHRVDALSESLHLSIGFVPLTLRDAIIATVDHLADLDKSLREAVSAPLVTFVRSNDFRPWVPGIHDAVARLLAACRSYDFIAEAMQRRSSRAIGDMAAHRSSTRMSLPISRDSLVRHSPLAICHLMANPEKIDFSQPGGHVYVHRGAQECVAFIAETTEFRVRDIPGAADDEIRIALAQKFVDSGFLTVVAE